jgi:hypothetical protein
MPHIPFRPSEIGPQRAAPKSVGAIEAEVKQVSSALNEVDLPDQPPLKQGLGTPS